MLDGWGAQETQQGRQLYQWKLPRSLNLEEESSEHLRWIYLKQVQHCTDLPLQVTFSAHTEQGENWVRVWVNVTVPEKQKESKNTGRKAGYEKRQATNFRET